jgi:hypothetical protein
MRSTRPCVWLLALLLGAVVVGHLGGCTAVLPHRATPPAFQAHAGPLLAVSPATLSLSGTWQFAVDPEAAGLSGGWAHPAFDDTGWQPVTVPHTWNVMPAYADYIGIAWYRRRLTLPPRAGAAQVRLRFGAIFYRAQVWWNGVYLGAHEGGYTPFAFDVSGLARPGAANVVVVRVDNQRAMDRLPAALSTPWSYDWWPYGGIVRNVSLHLSSRAFIAQQRLVAVPRLVDVGRADTATVTATLTVTNASAQALEAMLTGAVRHETGGPAVLTATPATAVHLPPGRSQEITLSASLSAPVLWHFDHPHLYRWTATLRAIHGPIFHTAEATFGVRALALRQARLYLNGEPVRLVGLTRHADSPAHGLAEPVTVMAADFAALKGLNAVLSRPAHYPQADFVLEYADRHGLLLIPELPAWQLSAAQLAHPRIRALARQQLREMIHSHANHPAVWAWSLGNEFASDTPAGHAWVRELMAVAKALDPTRPVGFASNRLGDQPGADATALTDMVMINAYYGTWSGPKARLGPALDAIHALWPDKPVLISEYGFAARWEWIHRRAGADPAQYYALSPTQASDAEAADHVRQQLIQEQLPVFRSRPFIAGAIFFTYQDHRTPNGLLMGVVDAWRQRRGAWALLREAYAPAVLDAVHRSSAAGGSRRATVVLRVRGPGARDLPAYTLQGYRLAWTVTAPEGQRVFAQGIIPLPTLPPGTTWSGEVEWIAPTADYQLILQLLRPTGFTVLEHIYNAHGERR